MVVAFTTPETKILRDDFYILWTLDLVKSHMKVSKCPFCNKDIIWILFVHAVTLKQM